MRGLGSRRRETDALGARNEALHEFGPAHFEFVRRAPMGALRHLPLNRLDDGRMGVAEQQRPVPAEVVDVFIAVDVPFARARRALGVDRIGQQRAGIVGEAGRNGLAGLGIELCRADGTVAVFGFDP